jgi:hypothetical protein
MADEAKDRLARNLAALRRHEAGLADAVAQAPPLGPLEPSRAGPPTTALPDDIGHLIQLASRVDPEREAERFVDVHLVDEPTVYVVVGLGLGYHVADLLRRWGAQDFLVVAEPRLDLVRSALERFDWSEPLSSGRLRIVADATKSALFRQLHPLSAAILMGARLIVHPASARLAPEFEERFRAAFLDFVSAAKVNVATAATNTAITVKNLLMNLPAYATGPGIDHLAGAAAGYPAIIVAAGPSLARNVHLLAEARDRAVIIAVATTLRLLLDRGIEPDFVTCLDFHEVSKRFFEGVPTTVGTHLVVEPKATWHVLDLWPGRMSVLGNDFLDECLRDAKPAIHRGRLPEGSTVAHLAFYLARYLGADPIILTGQDLGYSDGLYYMPGTAVHDTWRPELNRFWTLEMKEWERIARRRPTLRTIPDLHGRPMYTDDQMFTYLQKFEVDFQETKALVIDASEGGARKAGTTAMPLADALRQYAARPLPPELRARFAPEKGDGTLFCEAPPRAVPQKGSRPLFPALEAIRRRIEETRHIRQVCDESVELLERMRAVIADAGRAQPIFARIEALRGEIDEHPRPYRLVMTVGQIDQLRRFQADRRIGAAGLDGVEKQRRQIERDLEYIRGLAEVCDLFLELLEGGVDRLQAAEQGEVS